MPDAAVDSPTKAGETPTKRPRLESQNSKDADKDPHTWDLAGGTRIKNDGAGDCVFHAVAQGLTAHNQKREEPIVKSELISRRSSKRTPRSLNRDGTALISLAN